MTQFDRGQTGSSRTLQGHECGEPISLKNASPTPKEKQRKGKKPLF